MTHLQTLLLFKDSSGIGVGAGFDFSGEGEACCPGAGRLKSPKAGLRIPKSEQDFTPSSSALKPFSLGEAHGGMTDAKA